MMKKSFDYFDDKTLLNGYVSYNERASSPQPAVLICPDWTGRTTFTDDKANQLAELGYVGFAIDVYGGAKRGQTNDEKNALMQPFLQNRALLRQRLQAAFAAITQLDSVDKTKIAIMGFCFGGLCALDLARSGAQLAGAISFHGILTPPANLPKATIRAKILALHGYDDPMVPPEAVNAFAREMTDNQVDWQIHIYGNTTHAFTNPLANDANFGTVYNETADRRSWRALCDFLAELFNPSTSIKK